MRVEGYSSRFRRPVHQFGLRAVFLLTSFIGLELAIGRWLGRMAFPLCVELAICAGLLAWTRGRVWRGALIGLLAGGGAGAMIIVGNGLPLASKSSLLVATLAALGSWFGCAVHAAGTGFVSGLIALLGACYWFLVLMLWADQLFR